MSEVESIADALTASMTELSDSEVETEEEDGGISQEATEETTEVVEEEPAEEAEPEKVFQPPEHWSSDEKSQFEALPPEAQEVLLARDKAFQKGYQEKAQSISAISEALEPWKQSLAQQGLTADQAIRQLFAAKNTLDTNPLNGILQLAKNYGVLDQLQTRFAPSTDDDDLSDPEIRALKQEISSLKAQVSQTTEGIQQQSTNAVQQQIESFKNEKDADGALKHPHFDSVRALMGAYVQQGKTMQEAYENAVWTVPEFREALQKSVKKETEAERAARVKKAKVAAKGVKANGKAAPDTSKPKSLGEDLRAAWNELST
jgi:hypothetical protein